MDSPYETAHSNFLNSAAGAINPKVTVWIVSVSIPVQLLPGRGIAGVLRVRRAKHAHTTRASLMVTTADSARVYNMHVFRMFWIVTDLHPFSDSPS